jgi:prepilin-type N-terminal cleavage/methylation domain-containing protein
MMVKQSRKRRAMSLVEMLAAIVVLAIVAAFVLPRLGANHNTAKRNACSANRADIELQVQLWRRNHGSYPAANLSTIGANTAYFPQGLPVCPVDGITYTIDTTTGLVVGHAH